MTGPRKASESTTAPRQVIIRVGRNGRRRAQYLGRYQVRMFPMPVAQADQMLATGQAILCDKHPLTGEPIRAALTVIP